MPMIEIRWHGRGGQGGVTSAELLAKAAFLDGYKGVQAFPNFGAERRGAPVKAFTRISDKEINVRSQIYEPDIVAIMDPGIVDLIDPTEGIKEKGINPESMNKYVESFKHGSLPHGGCGFGVERLVSFYLDLKSVKNSSFCYRDPDTLEP